MSPDARDTLLRDKMERLFESNPELGKAVQSVVRRYPETFSVFERIIEHFHEGNDHERSTKRPKLEIEDQGRSHTESHVGIKTDSASQLLLSVHELSFVTPVRKKLNLSVTDSSIAGHSSADSKDDINVPFEDIKAIVLLPVPEKAAKQYNFCIFRKSIDEAVVFTVPDSLAKTASGLVVKERQVPYKDLISETLNDALSGVTVMEPDAADFVSAIPQPHRKQEPAVHLAAHRGSKEGYLFFLSTGLVYGFKRPLLYLAIDQIISVTYNDILQRTFNLTICIKRDASADVEDEIEFSMIDIAEHDAVDRFIRKYGLSDASLSESRRAKGTKGSRLDESTESEISKAADAIASTVDGHGVMDDSDDEEDQNFEDDQSHGGSTLASDESETQSSDAEGDIDSNSESTDQEE